MFEEIKGFFVRERERKVLERRRVVEEGERVEDERVFANTVQVDSLGYQSSPGNFINLFKSRRT